MERESLFCSKVPLVDRLGTASWTLAHTETQLRWFLYCCTLVVMESSSDRFGSGAQSAHVVPGRAEAINETDGESRVRSDAPERLRAKRVAKEVQRTFYNGGSSSIGSSSVLFPMCLLATDREAIAVTVSASSLSQRCASSNE